MKLLMLIALVLGVAFADCRGNPFFYMAGMMPPQDAPAVVEAEVSHPLCPTTFTAGQESCCTAAFLDTAQAHLDTQVVTFQAALDVVTFALHKLDLAQMGLTMAMAEYEGELQCAKTFEGVATLEDVVEATAESYTKLVMLTLLKDGVTEFHAQTDAVQLIVHDFFGAMLKQMHGMVCEACSPLYQLGVGAGPYATAADLTAALAIDIQSDDLDPLKAVLNAPAAMTAMTAIYNAATANMADYQALDTNTQLTQFAEVCSAGHSVDAVEVRAGAVTELQNRLNMVSSIVGTTADEAVDLVTEMAARGTFHLTTGPGYVLAKTIYATDHDAYARDIAEVWTFVHNCGSKLEQAIGAIMAGSPLSGCPMPNMVSVIMAATQSDTDFFTSTLLETYLQTHATYTLGAFDAGLASIDLFRLLNLVDEGDDTPNRMLYPTLNYLDPPAPPTGVAALGTYADAAAPTKVASESTVEYDTRIVEGFSAAHGLGFTAAVAALLVTLLL